MHSNLYPDPIKIFIVIQLDYESNKDSKRTFLYLTVECDGACSLTSKSIETAFLIMAALKQKNMKR